MTGPINEAEWLTNAALHRETRLRTALQEIIAFQPQLWEGNAHEQIATYCKDRARKALEQ